MPTQPIINPDRGFTVWNKPQIYTGPMGAGRIVPNVDDAVLDWSQGWFRVVSVHPVTHESTLDPVDFNKFNGGVIAEDALLSSGPVTYSESFRIHVNNTVTPHTVNFDGRLYMNTDNAHHVKIFKGVDISPTGHVISAMFNPSNVLISEDIPMVYVVLPTGTNVGVKSPDKGYLIEPLTNGEMVTAVFYDALGDKISQYRVITDVSDFVHTNDLGKQYVVSTELLTNFLSPTDDHLVECPINMALSSLGMQGRVWYNDGTHLDLPIDGNRFMLLGLDGYLPSHLGARAPLVLKYTLGVNEYGYGLTGVLNDRFRIENYAVTAIQRHAAYDVKVFVLPKWNTGTGQWGLEYYLYNLERSQLWNVTSLVQLSASSGTFNGGLLNTTQILTISLNLESVDPSFDYYLYTQRFIVSLRASGSNTTVDTYWLLQYETDVFNGSGVHALISGQPGIPGQYRLNLSLNFTEVDDWLNKVYWPTKPLYHVGSELAPPTPTHVRVKIDPSFTRELTLTDAILFIENITTALTPGMTVRLEFFQRTPSVDYELGMVSMNTK